MQLKSTHTIPKQDYKVVSQYPIKVFIVSRERGHVIVKRVCSGHQFLYDEFKSIAEADKYIKDNYVKRGYRKVKSESGVDEYWINEKVK